MKDPRLKKLLSEYGGKSDISAEEVIYGVYDNSRKSLWVRLNDFFIDHSGVTLQEKSYFFHLLAVMIDAGIPLLQSLQILKQREKNERFRRIIATLHYSVSHGKKFSEAMERFPTVFTDVEVGVVKSGEAVGRLNQMLVRLASELEKSHSLQMKLVSSSMYPLAVLATLVVVGIGMLIWVIPNLLGLLQEGGLEEKDYPLPTKVLVGATDVLQNYWWLIGLVILVVWGLFQVYVH